MPGDETPGHRAVRFLASPPRSRSWRLKEATFAILAIRQFNYMVSTAYLLERSTTDGLNDESLGNRHVEEFWDMANTSIRPGFSD
jgi:hypothetical protein